MSDKRLFFLKLLLIGVSLVWASSLCVRHSRAVAAMPIQESEAVWLTSMQRATQQSAISGKPILIKFEAEWCQPCKALDAEFGKPAFEAIRNTAILLAIDIDAQPEVAEDFAIESIPRVILIDANEEIIADKLGVASIDTWVDWMRDAVKGTEFEMPDMLASNEPPTRTEVKELISHLSSRNPTMREITIERLVAFPSKTRQPLIESLSTRGKLSQKIAALEILRRWKAPIAGLDPWRKESFTDQRMQTLEDWKSTPVEQLQTTLEELTPEDLALASQDLDRLLRSKNVRASLSRLTHYGTGLLPTVYERIKLANTDEEASRLTAVRYWLTASNELRLGWANGLIELASPDLSSRRSAAQALIARASLLDQALLLELFADPDPLVRELSLKGLNQIGAKETDATLATLLNDPDPNVRSAVLKQFAESEATQMVGAVAKYLATETDTDLIVHALRFLKTAQGDQTTKAILGFADHESWQVRAQVAEALGEIDADDLSVDVIVQKGDAIMKLLEDPDGFVVSRAIGSMPRKKDKRLLQQLAQIAMRRPDLATGIAESISEGVGYYSYDKKTPSAEPVFKQFLAHEDQRVRLAGIKALSEHYATNLDDQLLTPLLKDSNGDIRVAALTSMLARLESERSSITENVTARPTARRTPPSRSTGIFGLFGFSRNTETPPKKTSDKEDAKPKNDKQKKTKLPRLAQEKWLEKWVAGKIKIKLKTSREAINQLEATGNKKEQILILACKVTLGDHGDSLEKLIPLAIESTDYRRYLQVLLTWLPPEKRTSLFRQLAETSDNANDLEASLRRFSEIRNPDLSNVIWEVAVSQDMKLSALYQSLLRINFGDDVSYYSSLSDNNIDPNLIAHVASATRTFEQTKNPMEQKLLLAFMQKVDLAHAKKVARDWLESADNVDVQQLALKVLLLKEDSSDDRFGNQSKPNRAHAIEFLKTDKPWQFKQTLRYLALGEDTLNDSENANDQLQFGWSSSYWGGGSSDVKVRIPKPPKGLTIEQLDRPKLIGKDVQTKALVEYFRSLIDPKTELDALIKYWNSNKSDEDIAKLVYEAVASTNNDSLISVVDKIYQEHGTASEYYAAQLYWTIRVMDGKSAIGLRKRIRKQVGMSSLNNY